MKYINNDNIIFFFGVIIWKIDLFHHLQQYKYHGGQSRYQQQILHQDFYRIEEVEYF